MGVRQDPPGVASEAQVRIVPHGRQFTCGRERDVLAAALAAGLNLPHSCKAGHRGSCRARLLSGRIRYPDGRRPLGLAESEEREGWVLLCQARPLDDLVVEARPISSVADVEIKSLPCRIAALERLSPDVVRVMLRLPAVEPLEFHAGQYLDVLLEDGRRRSFSIASPPHEPSLIELHVRQVPGGGFTSRLFRDLQVGSLLRIEGPLGQFVYREGAGPVLLVAGGTGFAPMKSILRHVLEKGIEREIHLYWGARTADDLYEEALVLEWARRHPFLRFRAVLSHAAGAEAPHRSLGWVHETALAEHPDLGRFEVYAAGPPEMIEAIRASFPAQGLPADRLYFDSFDFAPDALSGTTGG